MDMCAKMILIKELGYTGHTVNQFNKLIALARPAGKEKLP
jgi:hypothetical protein|tara:strand:+ start:512 stop:631 length:120 start_codon:yes stop_codon:yes gene_type:complete